MFKTESVEKSKGTIMVKLVKPLSKNNFSEE